MCSFLSVLNANSSKTVKAIDFKFGIHVPQVSKMRLSFPVV